MTGTIIQLQLRDFARCSDIWNMDAEPELTTRFFQELASGNRKTYVYTVDDAFVAEISLVYEMDDADYTIPGKRAYVSRLIVKKEYRRQGIGTALVDALCRIAKAKGFQELSIGVDLDNFPAIVLYSAMGFDHIIYAGEDEQGRYLKLLKIL